MRDRVRRWFPVGLVLLLLVVLAVVTVPDEDEEIPLDPAGTGASGTAALVATLEELGAQVQLASKPSDIDSGAFAEDRPAPVILLLRDPLDDTWSEAFDAALHQGATIVITDPDSAFANPGDPGLLLPSSTPECGLAALRDVDQINGMGTVVYELGDSDTGCFPADDNTAWLVTTQSGAGTVVLTGGAGFLTNAALNSRDNAILAIALIAPAVGARVTIVGPQVAIDGLADSQTLTDLIPAPVRLALLQLLIAMLVVVAWRWRRLGKPVQEVLPVELPAAELVRATGDMLDQAGGYEHAATVLVQELRRDLALRAGLGPQADAPAVARMAASLTHRSEQQLLDLFTGPWPSGPAELVRLAQLVADTRAQITSPAKDLPVYSGSLSAGPQLETVHEHE